MRSSPADEYISGKPAEFAPFGLAVSRGSSDGLEVTPTSVTLCSKYVILTTRRNFERLRRACTLLKSSSARRDGGENTLFNDERLIHHVDVASRFQRLADQQIEHLVQSELVALAIPVHDDSRTP